MDKKFKEYKRKVGLDDNIPKSNKKGNIIISSPFPFVCGKPQSILVGAMVADTITITNTTTDELVLQGMNIAAATPKDSFLLSLTNPTISMPNCKSNKGELSGSGSVDDRILHPLQTLTIWLICCPKQAGPHISTLTFSIGDDTTKLVVFLKAQGGIPMNKTSDNLPKNSKKNKKNVTVDSLIKGVVEPVKPKTSKYKRNRLKAYPILKKDREFVASHQMPELLNNGPSRKNYASYFRTLMILEELGIEDEMKEYDMKLVHMKKKGGRFLSLEVPGLDEGRLSVVPGDIVYAVLPTQDHKKGNIYKGSIELVAATSISLQFSDKFHRLHSEENLYNISFTHNRVNFKRIYQAIEAAGQALRANVLFPSDCGERRRIIQLTKTTARAPISEALNQEQQRAIDYILACRGGAPYVIYGPPGTGKTKTLVELILQLYKTKHNSRILVCTSSNCAADHLLEQIVSATVKLKEDEILRLNAKSRSCEDVDPDLIKYCFVKDSDFECPPLHELRGYRIVVSTYISAHLLFETGIDRGHFTNIILDEAGQATEPETMIPIANFSSRNTTVVLAGDPKQLGPVLKSRLAERYGLGKSFLERLCESEAVYRECDPNYVTMLVRNYRSHPQILALPSKMFYDGKLIADAKENGTAVAGDMPWKDMLINREFPVIFYGVEGQNMKEKSNPSWFNQVEVRKVMRVVQKLVGWKVKEQDIGVIAPYKQQVSKIRSGLVGQRLTGIKVGSVEQFQGQEKEVIIVSTVRSTVKHDGFGRKARLGFLSNPKRFNVAVTRARSLLVIVGNPKTIGKDPCWGRLLWHCVDNGSFQGCGLPKRKSSDPVTVDKNCPAILNPRLSISTARSKIEVEDSCNTLGSTMGDWLFDEVHIRLNQLSINLTEDQAKPVKNEDDWVVDGWSL